MEEVSTSHVRTAHPIPPFAESTAGLNEDPEDKDVATKELFAGARPWKRSPSKDEDEASAHKELFNGPWPWEGSPPKDGKQISRLIVPTLYMLTPIFPQKTKLPLTKSCSLGLVPGNAFLPRHQTPTKE